MNIKFIILQHSETAVQFTQICVLLEIACSSTLCSFVWILNLLVHCVSRLRMITWSENIKTWEWHEPWNILWSMESSYVISRHVLKQKKIYLINICITLFSIVPTNVLEILRFQRVCHSSKGRVDRGGLEPGTHFQVMRDGAQYSSGRVPLITLHLTKMCKTFFHSQLSNPL